MKFTCRCNEGHPSISSIQPDDTTRLIALHHCSHCGEPLFEVELLPGMQMCATRDIPNDDGNYTIPKGRLVRLTGFVDKSEKIQLLFSGLLAVGSFGVEGFAAQWDIRRIVKG